MPMITLQKLGIYEEFDGDIDGWIRASVSTDKSTMADADWHLIDELRMGLTTVGDGLASPSFAREVEAKVLASTADDATRAALSALVARRGRNNVS